VAVACLAAAAAGVGLVLAWGRKGAIAWAILSGHGLLFMFPLRGELGLRVGSPGATLAMLPGCWAAPALFGVAGVANLLLIPRRGPAGRGKAEE
jgi:hypothetical protein